MTPEEGLAELKTILEDERDIESDHVIADNILYHVIKDLGYTELADIYNKIPKWYS